jgi:hypothetical protein
LKGNTLGTSESILGTGWEHLGNFMGHKKIPLPLPTPQNPKEKTKVPWVFSLSAFYFYFQPGLIPPVYYKLRVFFVASCFYIFVLG